MTIQLNDVLAAWGSDSFADTLKQALRQLDSASLPLQQAMSQGSHVSASAIDPVLLHSEATDEELKIKVGIFYNSVIAGSCCADDPSPMCEENEYCEVLVVIDRETGVGEVALL